MLSLSPGDMLHYPTNRAFGVLIEKDVRVGESDRWKYSLMSPIKGHSNMLISLSDATEEQILDSIEKGRLNYYAKNREFSQT